MQKAPPRVSIIVPVYNGAPFLEACVAQTLRSMKEMPYPSELIIAEDGSTDGTKELCNRLAEEHPEIRLLSFHSRLGRGRSLRRAFTQAQGDALIYLDVDMSTDFTHLPTLIGRVLGGAHVVTGSRYVEGSRTRRNLVRLVLSRSYNRLVRMLFESEVLDHQCGFKAFDRGALEELLPQIQSNHWFWDTEVLLRAQELEYRVEEIPVIWEDAAVDASTVDFLRDVLHFLKELVRLRGQMN